MHSLHQRLLQPLRKRVDQEKKHQPGLLLPLSNQKIATPMSIPLATMLQAS